MRRTPEALTAAVLVFLLAAPAAAQDDPRVYIVAVPMNDGINAIATRTGSAARAALRQIEGVNWRAADQRFLGYDDSALSILDRARGQLDAGRSAYLQLELDEAISQLQGAIENFDAGAAALEDPNALGQALLFLGATFAFNGQNREAQRVFARLHRQMPSIVPDPDTFPPEVVQLYQRATPRDARRPAGSVTIDSNPQGAIAYVDFLARGRTPITVDRLISGDHVVRVTRPGATPFVESMAVSRRSPASSNAYLVDAPDLEGLSDALSRIPEAGVDEIEDGSPIGEVATMLELDKIGVIRVSGSGSGSVSIELLLFDVASGRRLVRGQGTAPTGIGELESAVQTAVAGAFEAALRPSQERDSEVAPALGGNGDNGNNDDTDTGPEAPVTEQWWFWTIIAVLGAGLIAGGIAIGLATQGPALGQDEAGQVVFTF